MSKQKLWFLFLGVFAALSGSSIVGASAQDIVQKQKKDYSALFERYSFRFEDGFFLEIEAYKKDAHDANDRAGWVTFSNHGGRGSVLSIGVEKAYREHGLGSVLLQLAIKKLSEQGCKEIGLSPVPTNWSTMEEYKKRLQTLKAWYGKFGFQFDQNSKDNMFAQAPFKLDVVPTPECETW